MSLLRPRAGRVYFPQISAPGTILAAANTIYALPFVMSNSLVPDQIGIRVTTAGVGATAQCRLGIYADDGGRPGELIIDAGLLTGLDSLGAKTVAILLPHSLQLWGGTAYWLTSLFNTAGTTQPTVSASAAGAQSPMASAFGVPDMASLPNAAAGFVNGFALAQTFGALPVRFPAGNPAANAAIPLVGLRSA